MKDETTGNSDVVFVWRGCSGFWTVRKCVRVTGSPITGISPCASEATATIMNANIALEYAKQLLQYAEQIKQTADMVNNSLKAGSWNFGSVQAELNALSSAVQVGQSIAYSAANSDALYVKTFPGYGTYTANGGYYSRYMQWTQAVLDTMRGTLRAASTSNGQIGSAMGVINSLRGALSGTGGRLQALQVMGQMSDAQVSAMGQLRSLMLADLQSKQAYQAAQVQKDAEGAATAQSFFNYSGRVSDGKIYGAGFQ